MRLASAAGILLVLAASGCADGAGTSSAPTVSGLSQDGVVAYVNDGDTLRLRDGRRVRLLQIDAPELRSDCYGKAALSALRQLAPAGTRVMLESDPRLDARDGYGRLLRYVFVSGRNLNLALVRQGAASPYFYRRERGRYAEALLDAVSLLSRGCPAHLVLPILV